MNDSVWISKGFFPQNHRYEAILNGSITDICKTNNTISKLTIYNENGKDVTNNFYITYKFGTLIIENN